MELLLAVCMMIWSNLTSTHPDVTVEQMLKASLAEQYAVAAINNTNGNIDFIKQDPQGNETDAPVVKGVYATANSAGGARLQSLLKLLDTTELNSLVIDVKDDWGNITYKTSYPNLQKMGTTKNVIGDMTKLMKTLDKHEVYPIARIVVFKDSILANKNHALTFMNPDGTVWKNNRGESFVNPYEMQVWEYNVDIAKEVASFGFKEIQFDYVRFPEGFEKKADLLQYSKDERKRIAVIGDFVKYAREQLNPLGIRVSVDIFGYAASVNAAEGIGQDFVSISKYVDVISPMIYPSHYSTGWYGSKVPDAEPYRTINGAIVDTHNKLKPLGELKPIIRPWIQDFTATWIPGHITYGKKQVEAQINALKDNGVHEYLLWNSGNRYTDGVNF